MAEIINLAGWQERKIAQVQSAPALLRLSARSAEARRQRSMLPWTAQRPIAAQAMGTAR